MKEKAMPAAPEKGRPEDGPSVSAIIPVYNNEKTIGPLLDSLAAQTRLPEETIIVDDASSDRTTNLAVEHPFKTRIVRMPHNQGPAAARNRGASEADGEILFYLDSDIVLHPEAVAEVKAVFTDTGVKALNGRMEDKPLNSGWAVWYKCLVEYAWADFVPQWDDRATCFNTRIGAVRREVFREIGGFDTQYIKPLVEDHEFGQRLARRYSILFDKNLRAGHHFSNFRQTWRNYWLRTQALLLMLWNTPEAATDKGGASVSSALEFALGSLFLVSLFFIPWLGWWTPLFPLIVFAAISYKSLKYCLRHKGPLFYLYCLMLHAVYGLVVVAAGLKVFAVHGWGRWIKGGIS